MTIVVIMTFFLPLRSESAPNTTPPSGRMRKPTANTANVERRAEAGSDWLNIAAAMNGANTA